MFDTIAAVSTGYLNQPISIIKVSGPKAFELVSSIFDGKVGKSSTLTNGYIKKGAEKIDQVLISWFKGPVSFTGEDVVEINAHGGIINTGRILELLLSKGARHAERGEFSRRAFLNGKMDLVKAEAIHDLIFSKTVDQARAFVKKFDQRTSGLVENLKDKLLEIIATCEVNIDYPEYDDVEVLTTKKLIPQLESVADDLRTISKVSKSARHIFEGVKVAIIGKPNVGKSSLLNALLNEERAIVTNVPGTTRDIVKGSLVLGQVLLHLQDTAGIRSSPDQIEGFGINKSLQAITEADLIIYLIDPLQKIDEQDSSIEKALVGKNFLRVINKKDLLLEKPKGILISALKNDVVDLLNQIELSYKKLDLSNEEIITNSRQLALIEKSKVSIDQALEALRAGLTPDVVIVDIQSAWNDLANILGQADQVDLLDSMFKNFCLGK